MLAQSIAHFLTTKERLALARCSRHNRTLVEAPFAWHNADPITLKIGDNDLPSGPLLTFIPIGLVWTASATPATLATAASTITALAEHAPVVALHLYLRGVDQTMDASQLLQVPGLDRLQTLTLWSHTRRQIELTCKLPLLATLKLHGPLAAADASLLSAAPSLTDLTVTEPRPGCWPSVMQCPMLRCLTVLGFGRADLMACSQELGAQQLCELSLFAFSQRGLVFPAEILASALPCLRSLLVLRLSGVELDSLPPHVHLIPTLRRLIIHCSFFGQSLSCSDVVLLSLRGSPDMSLEWLAASSQCAGLESSLQPLVAQAGGRLLRTAEPNGQQARVCLVRDA